MKKYHSNTNLEGFSRLVIVRNYENNDTKDLKKNLDVIFSSWLNKMYNFKRTFVHAYIEGVKNEESRGTDSGINHKAA
jgi:hypothetical protein